MALDGFCIGRAGMTVALTALLSIGAVHAADSTSSGMALQCMQTGGTLPCKPALTTAWVYHADGKSFVNEAAAYAYMLQSHPPTSVFSLTQRWGRGDRAMQTLPARYERSIEVASWKLFLHCIPRDSNGPCEPQLGYPGYQRARKVICPSGYQFSSDSESPYCLPSPTGIAHGAGAAPSKEPAPNMLSDLAPRSR